MNVIYFNFNEVVFLLVFVISAAFIIRHFEIKHDKKKRDNFRNGYK